MRTTFRVRGGAAFAALAAAFAFALVCALIVGAMVQDRTDDRARGARMTAACHQHGGVVRVTEGRGNWLVLCRDGTVGNVP